MTLIVEATSSIVRPSNTTQYAVGDLVANSTTASAVVPLAFDLGTQAHSQCFIRRARVVSSNTSVTAASYRLHLYSKKPTVTNGDNGAFVSPKAGYLGAMDVTLGTVFSDGSFGVALPLTGNEVNFISEGDTIYGLLEARAAYTPTSGNTFSITLEAHRY